jgi:hypothetical protein
MTYKQGDSTSFDAFVQEIERKRDIATSSGAEVNDDVTKGVLFNNIKNTPGLLAVKALINATPGAYYKLAYHEMRDQFQYAIRLEASTEEEEDHASPSAVFRFGQLQQARQQGRRTEQRTPRGGPGPQHHADSRGRDGDARYDCDEGGRCAGDSRRDSGRCFDCDEKGHYAGDIASKDPSDISRKVQSGIRRHMKLAAEAESKGAAGGTGKAMVAWARDDAPGSSEEEASDDDRHPLPAGFRSSSHIFLACTTPCTTAASADVCTARHTALESKEKERNADTAASTAECAARLATLESKEEERSATTAAAYLGVVQSKEEGQSGASTAAAYAGTSAFDGFQSEYGTSSPPAEMDDG